MTTNKKIALSGGIIAVLGYTAVWVNKQIKKLQDFTLTFKKVKVNRFSEKELEFDAFYEYKNNSDIDINLSSQEYDIYINEVYVTTLKNYAENTLKANSVSPLAFNVNIKFSDIDKKLRVNYFDMIVQPKEVKIKIVMRWKVRLGFVKIPISYTWETNLKEILGWYLPVYRK